jgi:hypothetical protein
MISDEAGRALSLISGIGLVKDASAFSWRSALARLVLELDEAGNSDGVALAGPVLERLRDSLPDAAAGTREEQREGGAP